MACQVCGGITRLYYQKGAITLKECSSCGFIALDPLPDEAAVAHFYGDPFRGATKSYFTKVEAKLKRSRKRVRRLARMFGPGPLGKSFLDVGCNGGFLAQAAFEAGFAATGIDPDRHSIEYARAHYPACEFLEGKLEDGVIAGRRFDAVYCSEVIEHVPDANRFMGALAGALTPGGVLYLTTPDISHWRRPKDLTRWDAFCPPVHCLYFSPGSLALLLEKHGLAVIRRQWAFKPGIKLLARRL
jgi:SAM-dependent methyltransferase